MASSPNVMLSICNRHNQDPWRDSTRWGYSLLGCIARRRPEFSECLPSVSGAGLARSDSCLRLEDCWLLVQREVRSEEGQKAIRKEAVVV